MSNELKLPSHIYEEIPNKPIRINTNINLDAIRNHLDNCLIDLNNKMEICLTNQTQMSVILQSIVKKLEEFE